MDEASSTLLQPHLDVDQLQFRVSKSTIKSPAHWVDMELEYSKEDGKLIESNPLSRALQLSNMNMTIAVPTEFYVND